VYIVRLDPTGSLLWTKTVGGADDDQGLAVEVTADLGFVITGTSRSFGSGDNNIYALKLDANGSLQWDRAIVDDDSQDYSFHVFQASDGGYVLSGYSQPYGTSAYDMCLMKLDHEGHACANSASGASVASGGVSGSGGMVGLGGMMSSGGQVATGGAVTEECVATGIHDGVQEQQVSLFPNPANDRLAISGIGSATLLVRDALGRQVGMPRNVFRQTELNTAAWSCGAYFIELIGKDGARSVHTVIVNR
jgi:hypothetical protein